MSAVHSLDGSRLLHIRDHAAAFLGRQDGASCNSVTDPRQADADALTISGIQFLSQASPDPAQAQVVASLVLDQEYYRHLINPALLTPEESVAAAKKLSATDTRFLTGMVNAADSKSDRAHVTRALHILDALGKTNLLAHWMRRMTEHPDCFVRSMAVSMLCRLHVNPQLIEKQLDSKDARVRANAVEALWGTITFNAKRLLEKATSDPNHRVAVNALLGQYLAKTPGAAERMIALAQSDSPMLRAAVAWAMGYTCDSVFLPHLEQLSHDPEESVKKAAAAALGKYAGAEPVS